MVFVHGNPENAAVWGPLLSELDRADAFLVSPPGFGAPIPSGFDVSATGYRFWLASQLEAFGRPVDLVGHDWGGAHTVQIAMTRPDLLRSWVSDGLGVYSPDYVWHPLAQTWQTPEKGEELVAQLFEGTLTERLAVVDGLGMHGPTGERIAAGLDAEMSRAVLSLLRSAAQPFMSDAGRGLPNAATRPGLSLIAGADDGNGTAAMHRWAADQAGAKVVVLEGLGHWWPVENPVPAAAALREFWSTLD
ncbi:alpha/beta hydrolase [Agreia sp. Leaf244]|nr:alpha/beta hydrolase [Agreia sp. Leaf244]